jgi:hypothetical protein
MVSYNFLLVIIGLVGICLVLACIGWLIFERQICCELCHCCKKNNYSSNNIEQPFDEELQIDMSIN